MPELTNANIKDILARIEKEFIEEKAVYQAAKKKCDSLESLKREKEEYESAYKKIKDAIDELIKNPPIDFDKIMKYNNNEIKNLENKISSISAEIEKLEDLFDKVINKVIDKIEINSLLNLVNPEKKLSLYLGDNKTIFFDIKPDKDNTDKIIISVYETPQGSQTDLMPLFKRLADKTTNKTTILLRKIINLQEYSITETNPNDIDDNLSEYTITKTTTAEQMIKQYKNHVLKLVDIDNNNKFEWRLVFS